MAERIVIPRIGGPEVLAVDAFDPAPPREDEVAIDVAAIGVNFADVFCRLGLYEAAPPRPFTPGFEVAGVVAAAGERVPDLAVGERVFAITRFGGYATRINARHERVRRFPGSWSFEEAAAFPVVFLTAWHGLVNLAGVAAGETVVVQSAAGGVGIAACQLARALGARAIGTVGRDDKGAVAREAGAEEVIVSRRYEVWDEVRRRTSGDGVDVIFDAVGGAGLRRAFDALRPGGRLVVYGFAEAMPSGRWRNWPILIWRHLRTPRFHPLRLIGSNRTVAGFNLVHLWDREKLFVSAMDGLLAMVDRGEIRPSASRVFPFHRVAEAHEWLQSRQSTGKLVLATADGDPAVAPAGSERGRSEGGAWRKTPPT
jgi:NADPH:quinone reductase-like Zn-dependent oxidoreductase